MCIWAGECGHTGKLQATGVPMLPTVRTLANPWLLGPREILPATKMQGAPSLQMADSEIPPLPPSFDMMGPGSVPGLSENYDAVLLSILLEPSPDPADEYHLSASSRDTSATTIPTVLCSSGQLNNSGTLTHSGPLPTICTALVQIAEQGGTGGSGSEQPHGTGTRRRRTSKVTPTDKVLTLEQQLEKQQAEWRAQQQRNIYLKAREAVLEKLIELKEGQEERMQQLQLRVYEQEPDKDPFIPMGMTVKELQNANPSWFADKFNKRSQRLALRLAAAMPLLKKYPHLTAIKPNADLLATLPPVTTLLGPCKMSGTTTPGVATPSSDVSYTTTFASGAGTPRAGGAATPLFGHTDVSRNASTIAAAFGLDFAQLSTKDKMLLKHLQEIVEEYNALILCFGWMSISSYKVMLASSVHVSAMEACNTSWDKLLASISNLKLTDEPDTARTKAVQSSTKATVADQAHWHNLVAGLGLTHRQQLQLAILWDIINHSLDSIREHRAELGREMAEHLNEQQQGGHLPPPQHVLKPKQSTVKAMLKAGAQPTAQRGLSASLSASRQQLQLASVASNASSYDSPTKQALQLQQLAAQQRARAAVWRTEQDLTQQEVLLQRMHNSLAKENELVSLGWDFVWQTLTPVQAITSIVNAHPYKPDELSIMYALASLYNEAEVLPALLDTERSFAA